MKILYQSILVVIIIKIQENFRWLRFFFLISSYSLAYFFKKKKKKKVLVEIQLRLDLIELNLMT